VKGTVKGKEGGSLYGKMPDSGAQSTFTPAARPIPYASGFVEDTAAWQRDD
jgi:hypothetical protein